MAKQKQKEPVFYLMVKTHLITGLKYLCVTKRDPLAYAGSGVIWKKHLREHGKTFDTKIIMMCRDKESLRHWGLYYSNMWNVAESKEWANVIPENGTGSGVKGLKRSKSAIDKTTGKNHYTKREGYERPPTASTTRKKMSNSRKGEKHPMYRSEVYHLINLNTKEEVKVTQLEFRRLFGLSVPKKNAKGRISGWIRYEDYDDTLYLWTRVETNQTLMLTIEDFIRHTGLDNSRTYFKKIIARSNDGKIRTIQGWTVSPK